MVEGRQSCQALAWLAISAPPRTAATRRGRLCCADPYLHRLAHQRTPRCTRQPSGRPLWRDTMLTFSDVSKRFGAVQALADCSFSVARGRMLGFLGPNGAGKTTAMRAVFGLVRLDAGELLWDGRPVGLAERLRFGYMPEERGLYPRMSLAEQLDVLRVPAWAHRGRGARRCIALARAPRTRGSRRREGRGALAWQPAARTTRGGVAASAGAARPRRAFRRARPGRGADARGGPARRSSPRRCRPLLQPSARARGGHLRGGRDRRPRADRGDRGRGRR